MAGRKLINVKTDTLNVLRNVTPDSTANGGLHGGVGVSVIIPAFNYGKYISATLDSLIAQTYQDWECVVVDDSSTDNTAEVIASYSEQDARFIYICQDNAGPSSARNRGLSKAKGRYIQFLDADDLLERRKMERHVKCLENNPDVDLVYGEARYFRTENLEERRLSTEAVDVSWMPKVSGRGRDILKTLIKENIMVISAPLVRRSAMDQIGFFDEKVVPVEDWDYWIRFAINDKYFHFASDSETLSLIRCHSNSLSHDKRRMRRRECRLRRKLDGILPDNILRDYNRLILAGYYGDVGVKLVEEGSRLSGSWYLTQASYWSVQWNSAFKWAYSALAALIAPKRIFQEIVCLPFRKSLSLLFKARH
jgi:glycosyltransferase involved in cell wall biosynthesis